jgi:hypothetical protein
MPHVPALKTSCHPWATGKKETLSLEDLKGVIPTSESTLGREIDYLSDMNQVRKICGGIICPSDNVHTVVTDDRFDDNSRRGSQRPGWSWYLPEDNQQW